MLQTDRKDPAKQRNHIVAANILPATSSTSKLAVRMDISRALSAGAFRDAPSLHQVCSDCSGWLSL